MPSSLLKNLTDIGGPLSSTDLVYVAQGSGPYVDRKAAFSRFQAAFAPISPDLSTQTTGNLPLATRVSGILPVANGGSGTSTAFTAGSVVFAGAAGVYEQDNANLFWDNTNNRLGIGITTPAGLLHVASNTTALGLTIFEQASADTDSFDLNFRKTRGTVASPTAITSGDALGIIAFRGYSGAAGYVTAASIRAVSSGTIATTRVASSLVFATGTDAAPTVLTDRMTILNSGFVGIGTSGPGAVLEVSGAITGGATSLVIFTNSNLGVNDQNRLQLLRGQDAGSGASKGMVFFTQGTGATGGAGWADYEARPLIFYAGTAAGSTVERFRISNAGLISFGGTTSSFPALKRSSAELQVRLADDSAFGNLQVNSLIANAQVRLKGYTVATLPGSPTQGDVAFVTDALTPTFLTAAVGGGAIVSTVLYNGTTWVTV